MTFIYKTSKPGTNSSNILSFVIRSKNPIPVKTVFAIVLGQNVTFGLLLQGVDILVFPEYGITGWMGPRWTERSAIYPYAESVPDVSRRNPYCVHCDSIPAGMEGQTAVGCLAKQHHMYVVANLVETAPCDQETDSWCPSDGQYLFNTNIIYDRNGCLIAKYHKHHRYAEEFERMDRPENPEMVYFDTEFGRFGTMVCNDAVFEYPGINLIENYGVDNIIFPTAWDQTNGYVYYHAVQWQIAFAARFNVNFLAANTRSYDDYLFGSGIYSGANVLNYTSSYDDINGQLIIADVPVQPRRPSEYPQPSNKEYRKVDSRFGTTNIYGEDYNVTNLKGLSGEVSVCQKELCCTAQYERNTTEEMYILGAFKGLGELEGTLAYQNCVVFKCTKNRFGKCGKRQIVGVTAFSYLHLYGNMDVKYVFPSVLPSDQKYEKIRWRFRKANRTSPNSITLSSSWPMIGASLVGRDLEKDIQI